MQRATVWSPIWEDANTGYTLERFNGTLDAWSEFRGPPSKAVDDAWSSLDDGMVTLLQKVRHKRDEY